MIGDGLADEPGGKWIRKEYNQTLKALGMAPPRKKRRSKSPQLLDEINRLMAIRITEVACPQCKNTASNSPAQAQCLHGVRHAIPALNCSECKRNKD